MKKIFLFLLLFALLFNVFAFEKVWDVSDSNDRSAMVVGNPELVGLTADSIYLLPYAHVVDSNTKILFSFDNVTTSPHTDMTGNAKLVFNQGDGFLLSKQGSTGKFNDGISAGGAYTDEPFVSDTTSAIGPFSEFTIDAWVKNTGGGGTIGEVAGSFIFWIDANGRVCIEVNGTELRSLNSVSQTGWTHVAGVASESTNKLHVYIDGKLDSSVTWNGSMPAINNNLIIGTGDTLSGSSVAIDEFRISNIARDSGNMLDYPTYDSTAYVEISDVYYSSIPATKVTSFEIFPSGAGANVGMQLRGRFNNMNRKYYKAGSGWLIDSTGDASHNTIVNSLTESILSEYDCGLGGDSLSWRIYLKSPDGHTPLRVDSIKMVTEIKPNNLTADVDTGNIVFNWGTSAWAANYYMINFDSTSSNMNDIISFFDTTFSEISMSNHTVVYPADEFYKYKKVYWSVAYSEDTETYDIAVVDSFINDPVIVAASYSKDKKTINIIADSTIDSIDTGKWRVTFVKLGAGNDSLVIGGAENLKLKFSTKKQLIVEITGLSSNESTFIENSIMGTLELGDSATFFDDGTPRPKRKIAMSITKYSPVWPFVVVPGNETAHLSWEYHGDIPGMNKFYIFKNGEPFDSVDADVFYYKDTTVINANTYEYSVCAHVPDSLVNETMSMVQPVVIVLDIIVPQANKFSFFPVAVKSGDTVYYSVNVSEYLPTPPVVTAGSYIAEYDSAKSQPFLLNYVYYLATQNMVEGVYPCSVAVSDFSGNSAKYASATELTVDNSIPGIVAHMSPLYAKDSTEVSLELLFSEPLFNTPIVTVYGINPTGYATDSSYIYRLTVLADSMPEGSHPVFVSFADVIGNQAQFAVETLFVDYTPDSVLAFPISGEYPISGKGFKVKLFAPSDCSLYYTTDGTIPEKGNGSTRSYADSIVLNKSGVINALSIDPAGNKYLTHFNYVLKKLDLLLESWNSGVQISPIADLRKYDKFSFYRKTEGETGFTHIGDRDALSGHMFDDSLDVGKMYWYYVIGHDRNTKTDTSQVDSIRVSSSTVIPNVDLRPIVEVGKGRRFEDIQSVVNQYDNVRIILYPGEYSSFYVSDKKRIDIRGADLGGDIPIIDGGGEVCVHVDMDVTDGNGHMDSARYSVDISRVILRNADTAVIAIAGHVGLFDVLIRDVNTGLSFASKQGERVGGSLNHVTVAGNNGDVGINYECKGFGELFVTNSIFSGFRTGLIGDSTVVISYNDFWDTNKEMDGNIVLGSNNKKINPLFLENEYYLSLNSPVIDAASDNMSMGAIWLGKVRNYMLPSSFNINAEDLIDDENHGVKVMWGTPDETEGLCGYILIRKSDSSPIGPSDSLNTDIAVYNLGLVNEFLDSVPLEDTNYYYWITSKYVSGAGDTVKTDFSGPAVAEARDDVRPFAVTNFRAFDTPLDRGNSITLTWKPSASSDVKYQRIGYLENIADTSDTTTDHLLPDTLSASDTTFAFTTTSDGKAILNNKVYYLAVITVDDAGNDNLVIMDRDVKSAMAYRNEPSTELKIKQYFGAIQANFSVADSGSDSSNIEYNYSLFKNGGIISAGTSEDNIKIFKGLSDGNYRFRVYATNTDNGLSDLTPADTSFKIVGASSTVINHSNKWNLISIPAVSIPVNKLKANDEIFTWKEENDEPDLLLNRYVGKKGIKLLERKRGYWFKTVDTTRKVFIPSDSLKMGNIASVIRLLSNKTGWNMIGNPFTYAVDLSESGLKFFTRDSIGNTYTDGVSVLEPWRGYWVKVDSTLVLRVPAIPYFPTDNSSGKVAKSYFVNAQNWKLKISAKSGNKNSDLNNYIGFSPMAKKSYDKMDSPEPPMFGDDISLSFVFGTYPKIERLTKDIKNRFSGTETWTYNIRGADDTVLITIDNAEQLPDGMNIYAGFMGEFKKLNKYNCNYKLSNTKDNFYELVVSDDPEFLKKINVKFALHQNFPNPFNPSTVIRYTLPQNWLKNGMRSNKKVRTSLVVYSVLGEKVFTLIDKLQSPGHYSVNFYGKRYNGADMASGFYIYRLKAGKFVSGKRMLLVK